MAAAIELTPIIPQPVDTEPAWITERTCPREAGDPDVLCPWANCRYNLLADGFGALIRLTPPSCAIDIAIEGDHTLKDVGDILKVTRERIRQIEATALFRMDKRLAQRDISREVVLEALGELDDSRAAAHSQLVGEDVDMRVEARRKRTIQTRRKMCNGVTLYHEIIAYVCTADEPVSPRTIVRTVMTSVHSASNLLSKAVMAGDLRRVSLGLYAAPLDEREGEA